mmetsp:Transcript_7554/g.11955  ORF Transcript_7554/g.11955 Transcript_7554/m.11955 type:complete len:495 (-) Transcript_7554:1815-3299(-)
MLRAIAAVAVLCSAVDAELLGFKGLEQRGLELRSGRASQLAFMPQPAGAGQRLSQLGSATCGVSSMPSEQAEAATGLFSLQCKASNRKSRRQISKRCHRNGAQTTRNIGIYFPVEIGHHHHGESAEQSSPHASSVSGFADADLDHSAQPKNIMHAQLDMACPEPAAAADKQPVWQTLTGRGRMNREYTLFYHSGLGTVVEIPHGSESVMFRTNGKATIQRCWGDCNMYERFTFEADASLVEQLEAGEGSDLSQSNDGAQLGSWSITIDKDGVLASYKGGVFQLHLTRHGFVVIGEGSRCVKVMDGEDALILPVCNVEEEVLVGGVHEQVMEDHGCNQQEDENCAVTKSAENIVRAYTGQQPDVPKEYLCPLTGGIMADPVVAADGYSYSKEAWSEFCSSGGSVSPVTGEPLEHQMVLPNIALRDVILAHLADSTCEDGMDEHALQLAEEVKSLKEEIELLRARVHGSERRSARKERAARSSVIRPQRENSPAPL